MTMTVNTLIPLQEHGLDFSFPLDFGFGLNISLVLGKYMGFPIAQPRGRVFMPAHVLQGLFSSFLV